MVVQRYIPGSPRQPTFIGVAKSFCPEILDSDLLVRDHAGLRQSSAALKAELRKLHSPRIVDALPFSALASTLVSAFRPEEKYTRISATDVIEFMARFGGNTTVFDYGSNVFDARRLSIYANEMCKCIHDLDGIVSNSLSMGVPEFASFVCFELSCLEVTLFEHASPNLIRLAAEFLANYLATVPEDIPAILNFDLERVTSDYISVSRLRSNGKFFDVGCGEAGLVLVGNFARPLLLLDHNPFITGVLSTCQKLTGRSDVEIITSDIAAIRPDDPSYRGIGVMSIEFVLHYLTVPQIYSAVSALLGLLEPSAAFSICEPERGCCHHNTPHKLAATRDTLRQSNVTFSETFGCSGDIRTVTFTGTKN